MSTESYISCDMNNCKGGKHMFICPTCNCDVCSLCLVHIENKMYCPLCFVKMLNIDDLEELVNKGKLKLKKVEK